MATRTVHTDAEQAKRNAVKRLIASGKGGYKDAETATAGNADLAAAGAATVSGDPVDLGAAAQATASAISAAPSADANRYAEATRVIFEDQAKSRGATSMRRLGDEWDTQVEASNFALSEYDKELAAAEAARRRGGSYGGSGSGTPTLDIPGEPSFSENFTDQDLRRSDVAWQNIGDEAAQAVENAARASLAAGNDWPSTASVIYRDMIRQGYLGPEITDYLRFLEEILVGSVDPYQEPESDASSIMRARQAANAANSPPTPTGNPGTSRGNPDI